MRTVDRPFKVSIDNGLVKIECAGAIATIDPGVAAAAGRRMVADAPLGVQGKIGRRLIESADASRASASKAGAAVA
jgi:hypothetical protein